MDIGTSPEAIELQAAISTAPHDADPQLVLADLLLSADDPRGELIVLDQRDREGRLEEPAALERYALLAAAYGFPRVTPDDPVLPFASHYWSGGGSYILRYNGHIYYVRHRRDQVMLLVDDT